MSLIRVTPETAAATVESLVQDFRDMAASVGRSPAIEKIQRSADELAGIASGRVLEVEVRLAGELPSPLDAATAEYLGIPPSLLEAREREETSVPGPGEGRIRVVRLRFSAGAPARRAGERVAPVLVVARGSVESPAESLMKELVADMQGRPLTLIVAPPGSDWARALQGLASRSSFACRVRTLDGELAARSLEAELEAPAWSDAAELASAWSVVKSLASLHEAFAVALQSEQRALGAKRALVDQQMDRQGSQQNPTEVIGEVRSTLQKQFDRFQKSFSAKLDELLDPHEGTLAVEIETAIRNLSGFDVEKKPKIDVLTVPDAVQKGMLERAETELKGFLRNEIRRLDDVMRETEARVERSVESMGGPPLTVNLQRLDRKHLQTFVDRSVTLQRPYRGEVSRRGPMDFFMAARRYQMIFFMVASAFGLSFIRSYREITIPIGILLLSYGLLSVVNSARRQRAETEEKELNKAREALRTDFKRVFSDLRRAWEQAIGNHLSEQQGGALEKVDSGLKSFASRTAREAAQERELLQEQIKNLDNSKRKMSDGIKKSEAARGDLDELVVQVQGFYAAAVPKAEAPGSGSAAGEGASSEGEPKPKAGGGELPTAARVALESLGKTEGKSEAAEKLDRLRKGGATQMFQTLREKRMGGKGDGSSSSRPGSSPRASASSSASSSSRGAAGAGGSASRRGGRSSGEGEKESPAERLKRLKEGRAGTSAKPSRPSPGSEAGGGEEDPKNDVAAEAAREAERLQARAAEQLAKLQGGSPPGKPSEATPSTETPSSRADAKKTDRSRGKSPGRLGKLKGGGGLTQAFATLKNKRKGGGGPASGEEKPSRDESSSDDSES